MVMRYHWGLGIGHLYTRKPSHHADEAVRNLESTGEGIQEEYQNEEMSTFGGMDTEDLEHSLIVRDTDDLGDPDMDGDSEQADGLSGDELYDDELYALM